MIHFIREILGELCIFRLDSYREFNKKLKTGNSKLNASPRCKE